MTRHHHAVRLALALVTGWIVPGAAWSKTPEAPAQPAAAQSAPEPAHAPGARAAPQKTPVKPADDLRETIDKASVTVTLADGRPLSGDMILTHFRPKGEGPFPVVIASHGRDSSKRAEPGRYRSLQVARFWVRRGFAVIVPTRLGYGDSGHQVDPEFAGRCGERTYRAPVDTMVAQIEAAGGYARRQAWADTKRIVLMGQSYGGLGSIAAAARVPGTIAAVNFAGGGGGRRTAGKLREPCQPERVAAIYADAGRITRVPTLWLYAENDQLWGKDVPRTWVDAFRTAGGSAEFHMLTPVADDGHALIAKDFTRWRRVLDAFLAPLGFAAPRVANAPEASDFAPLEDAARVPHIKEGSRERYERFLKTDLPRAFALAPNGAWAYRSGEDAVDVAMARCRTAARRDCRLYAVDDRVVWRPQPDDARTAGR